MPSKPVSPIDQWKDEAAKLAPDQIGIPCPFYVLQGEAVDVARFFDKYFKSTDDRPGLETVVDKKRHLTESTGKDILSLLAATQQANTAYQLAASPSTAAPIGRATFVLNDIAATLEWSFDDGVEDERDAQLASVKKAHADTPDSHDAWAAELEDYAALAGNYRKQMAGLGGFDVALIDEAKALAAELRNRPATPAAPSEAVASAKALRDRLAALLCSRMATVRSAARFVFRNQPAIIREATSAYERRRKAAARRNAAKKPSDAPGDTPS
jgi:hypothetical protein